MQTQSETTERGLIEEVEELLNDVGFCGDFENASRPLLRRLVEEVKLMRKAFKAADGLAQINEACWDSTRDEAERENAALREQLFKEKP